MHTSRGTRRGLALLAAVTAVTLLAACSSSKKGTPSSPTTSGSSSTTAAASTAATTTAATTAASSTGAASTGTGQATGSAPDKQALAALLLQPSDLPAGWKASPASPSTPSDAAHAAQLASCVGIPDTAKDKVAEANSSDFSNQNASISSSATSYSSPLSVTTDASMFQQGSKVEECFKKLAVPDFEKNMPAGTKIDNVSLKVRPGSAGAPPNVVGQLNLAITVTTSGTRVSVYIDSYFIAGKQIEAEVDFENVGQPIASSLQAQLVTTVAQRVATA